MIKKMGLMVDPTRKPLFHHEVHEDHEVTSLIKSFFRRALGNRSCVALLTYILIGIRGERAFVATINTRRWVLIMILAFAFQPVWGEGGSEAPAIVDKGTQEKTDKQETHKGPPLSSQASKLLSEVKQRISNIHTKELQTLLKEKSGTVFIDVRAPEEITLRGGSIDAPQHFNIQRGWLEFQIDNYVPHKDTPIVVYCGVNQRSPLAADTLMKLGYSNVRNYADGFFAWQQAGLPVDSSDQALDSFLYSKPQEVIPGVWSAIGATAPPTYANSGHNNNLSFIVTEDGVLVVNAGDNYLLAKSMHEEIKKITSQPVRYVVLENAQGHAMLGSNYWQEQGAQIIAHKDAAKIIKQRGSQILERMQRRNRDKAFGTKVVMPDQTFVDKHVLKLGDERIELLYLGPAHSPGDVLVWLPKKRLVIAGDMAFHERLLPVFEYTDTAAWLETWEKFAALDAQHVIPGHGGPTSMQEVSKYTRDYLVHMRKEIQTVLDDDKNLEDAYTIDQSSYTHLDTFNELSRSNAGTIFRAMEFE